MLFFEVLYVEQRIHQQSQAILHELCNQFSFPNLYNMFLLIVVKDSLIFTGLKFLLLFGLKGFIIYLNIIVSNYDINNLNA